ncbi:MAG TPA: protein phosphatase 2C domain-containing protein [Streptosporangiaceae bacterium]|nr:protein phosphatase 2C domain-containing protein [Streptosporangiaceae bacterium]
MALDYASRTSQGARGYQEDAARVHATPAGPDSPAAAQDGHAEQLTAVLADGMGGHAGGALASSTACGVFLRAFETATGDVSSRLNEALMLANEAIAACVEDNPALDGMGCTLVGAAIGRDGIEWVSVGDSPMFLIRRGEVFLLNEDHSLAPEIDKLAAAGKMTWEDAQNDPRRHFLRSALTGSEIELIDRQRLALEPGDVVLIASDGIQTLSRQEILDVVEANIAGGPDAIADALLAAVDAAGDIYQDNTTVVVVTLAAD